MKKSIRRLLSIGVSALLSISTFLTVIPQTETIAYGDTGSKAIVLVDNGAAPNINGAQASSVYFGKYPQTAKEGGGFNDDPIKWRVLQNASGKLFLLSDQNLDDKTYNETNDAVTWETCTLRGWLNSDFIQSAFTSGEQGALATTRNANPEYFNDYTSGGTDTEDKVFLLSKPEAWNNSYGFPSSLPYSRTSVNTAYVKAQGASTLQESGAGFWWLRSPGRAANCATEVLQGGGLSYNTQVNSESTVRPALNIDLSSVILTSDASGGKDPGGTIGTLKEVGTATDSEWKLTISDSARSSFTASAGTGATVSKQVGYTSWTVPVTYSGAQAGENEHVSAILTNSSGVALYYGYIATDSTGDTKNVTIPTGLAEGTYTLKIFNEQCNGDKKTDLSSAFHDIELTVTGAQEQVATPTFSPAAGTYTEAQNVTISCATDGATIHYTMDGTEPTATSTTYDSPINISETTTIKAIAIKDGMTYSEVATAKYTINHPVPEKTYTVTVIADQKNGGTASADIKSGKSGTKVTIAAAAQKDYEFKEWKVLSGGVALADPKQAITTFTIGSSNVEVEAVFEKKAEPGPDPEPTPGPTQKDISKATVSGIKNKTYTGKALKQSPVVKLDGKILNADTDYTLSYKNNTNAGTAKVTITGKGDYTGSVTKNFKIKQAANKLTVKAKKATYSSTYSENKNKSISGTKIYKFTNKKKTKGEIKYTLLSVKKGSKKVTKGFSVNKGNGRLKLAKGVAKGSYKITVKVTAGNKNYKTVTKDVKFTLKIK